MEPYANARPQIRIDGQEREDLQDALLSACVQLPIHGMAHGELKFTNWGIKPGQEDPELTLLDIRFGASVELSFQHGDELVTAFSGEVTGIEERYGDGAPQLSLLVQDKLHLLARARFSRTFEESSVDDIVSTISQDAGLQADSSVSTETAHYHQLNESNLAFLFRLVGAYNVYVRMQDGNLRVKPEEPDAAPVLLSPEDSVDALRITADLNLQPTDSRVLGFNAATAEPVDSAAAPLAPGMGTPAKDLLDELGWPGEEIVPQPFPRTSGEADAFANAHFQRAAQQFLTGHVRCRGEPSLRGGREIELQDVSPRVAGTYRVTECAHLFSSSEGFTSQLTVRRGVW